MKNVNFDSLTNIKAPDAWIENALNIPQTVEKKKPLFFIKHARTLAAVASLVFVSVISIVFFLSNDRITPQVDPNTKETKATISSAQTDYSTQHKEKPSKAQNQEQENKTQNPTTPYEAIEPPEGDSPQKPTTGSDSTEKPTAPIGPTIKPTTPVHPTEGYIPTPPTDDWMPPSEYPEPTEGEEPWIPGYPVEPSEPDAPPVRPTVKPTTPTENPFNNIHLSGSVPLDSVEIFDKVYCMIYDSNGHLIGDSNLYSSQHYAYFTRATEGKIYLNYDVPNGLITKHDTYSYYFYDSDGVILYYGTKYI